MQSSIHSFHLMLGTTAQGPPAGALSETPPQADLPQAVLIHLLRLAGCGLTAARAACVSRGWRDAVAAAGTHLFTSVDLSHSRATDSDVERLCASSWGQLQSLTLNSVLSDRSLLALSSHPTLSALDVSGCVVSGEVLATLLTTCRLQELSAARCELKPAGDASLRALLARATFLHSLSLAGCARLSSGVLRGLSACHRLTALDLTSAGSRAAGRMAVPLEGLHQLQVLRLSALGLDHGFQLSFDALGLPALRVCELASGARALSGRAMPSDSTITDSVLIGLLWRSTELEELVLGGTHVSAAGLAALPAHGIIKLLLDHSPAACDASAGVVSRRWSSSMRHLSLAGKPGAVTDAISAPLSCCGQLLSVDLSGSAVTCEGVRQLLVSNTGLRVLTLTACRSLDRTVRLAAGEGIAALRLSL